MKAKPVKILRDVTTKECPWLDKTIKKGTIMFEFTGHTYGCCSSDGTPLTHDPDGEIPFMEVPNNAIGT
jgi:hypothetical protein